MAAYVPQGQSVAVVRSFSEDVFDQTFSSEDVVLATTRLMTRREVEMFLVQLTEKKIDASDLERARQRIRTLFNTLAEDVYLEGR